MAEMFMDDVPMKEIAGAFGVTRQRVHQILTSCGIDASAIRAMRSEEKRRTRRERLAALREEAAINKPSIGERFMARVAVQENGCWLWTGAINKQTKYGCFNYFHGGKNQNGQAHRFSYEFFHKRPIPEGLEIDHLCRTRPCVNPHHLEASTHRENVLRGAVPFLAGRYLKGVRLKTCVKGGHPMEDGNVIIEDNGSRRCAECLKDRYKRFYLRKLETVERRLKKNKFVP